MPTIPADTRAGGKGEDGRAHVREPNLDCLFTRAGMNDQCSPRRHPASSGHFATLASAAAVGALLYSETMPRRLHRPERLVVLGDGGLPLNRVS